jgi:O-antigen ligase
VILRGRLNHQEKKLNFMQWAVAIAVAAFPVLSIVMHNAGNACLYLLLICSMLAAGRGVKPMDTGFLPLLRQYWPLHLAMAGLVVATLLNHLSTGNFSIRNYDRALRLAVFAPVFWIILLLPIRYLRIVQWSAMAGVLLALLKAYALTEGGLGRPTTIGFLSTIAYSNIAFLLGTIAVISIGWNHGKQKTIIALKLLAFCAGIYTTILTATRSSWLAVPAVMIFGLIFIGRARIKHKYAIAIFLTVLLGGFFFYNPTVQSRVAEVVSDIGQYRSGQNPDTSIGLRLQMWQASWLLFKAHPVFGIGRENYSREIADLAGRGIVTPAAAHFAHSHNELLFNMAISGIFGLIATLAIYCVPAFYFAREIRHPDRQIRTAAGIGVVHCLCFFIYGFTDIMFFWAVLGGFYAITVAVFLTFIIKRKEELKPAIRRDHH